MEIYCAVLVSGVWQSDSITHIFILFFRLFSHSGYYRILRVVPGLQ